MTIKLCGFVSAVLVVKQSESVLLAMIFIVIAIYSLISFMKEEEKHFNRG